MTAVEQSIRMIFEHFSTRATAVTYCIPSNYIDPPKLNAVEHIFEFVHEKLFSEQKTYCK